MNKKTKRLYRKKSKTQKRKLEKGGNNTSETRDLCPYDDDIMYRNTKINPKGKYYNQYHMVCIYDTLIYYITPKYLLYPDLESIINIISKFSVLLPNNTEIVSRKVRIDNRYVSCFVRIKNDWYAILRLIGTVLVDGYFAPTHKLRVYFRLKPNVIKRHSNGLIEFVNKKSYEEYAKDTIKLKDEYVDNITIDKDVRNCHWSSENIDDCYTDSTLANKRGPDDDIFMLLDVFRTFFIHPTREAIGQMVLSDIITGK